MRALRVFCWLAAALPVPAQFVGLGTPYDGSVVYFSSTLRLKGTDQPLYGKLFEADEKGVRLFRSRERVDPPGRTPIRPPDDFVCALSNAYEYTGAAVSGGIVAASTLRTIASGNCVLTPWLVGTEIIANGTAREYTGLLRLSPNGRYALHFDYPAGIRFSARISRIDLSDGSETDLATSNRLDTAFHMIADDGTAVFLSGAAGPDSVRALLARPGQAPAALSISGPIQVSIDASARRIVYSRRSSPGLVARDLTSGQETLLADGLVNAFAISDDGERVVYLSAGRLYVAGGVALTEARETVSALTLSGDGRVAYVTADGRLLKVDTASGARTEVIGRTPYLTNQVFATAGLMVTLAGAGLADAPLQGTPPLNPWLGKVTMWMGERKVPLYSLSPWEVRFLVPWDAGTGDHMLMAEAPGERTPFDFPRAAVRVDNGPRTGAIYHQDWSAGTVDFRLGEIVHIFAVGLGAVTPEVDAGSVGPVDGRLSWLVKPLICENADVLFAGLAPGSLERVYQVDLRLNATGYRTFNCTGGASGLPLTFNVVR